MAVDERAYAVNGLERRERTGLQPRDEIPVAEGLFAKVGAVNAGSRAIRLDLGKQRGCCGVQFFNHLCLIA